SWRDPGLFFLSAAVTGQIILEQHSREVTVRQGGAVTFQCSMRGAEMSDYYMYWYRQGPGGSLEWIWLEDSIYGECFQDRFKGERQTSQNRLQL
ncbi:HV692 protein, partial [Grantiella picta]|nr:HV692 protein [Grantiella picta]